MPEPVVIIGPASGPAGPIPGQPDSAVSPPGAADRAEGGETLIPPSRGLRIVRGILSILGRVSWAIATAILHVISRNPRHSIAAAASLLILGGIFYSQTRSGSTRRDVTNAISPSTSPKDSESKDSDAAKPDPAVAAAPKSEASDPEKKPASVLANAPKSADAATATAQTDATPLPNLPAPKPDTTHDSAAPATSLAKADTAEKGADGPPVAPAPGPAAADLPPTPLPAPGGELAKATLLDALAPGATGGAAPAPAPGSSLPKDEKNGGVPATASSPTGAMAQTTSSSSGSQGSQPASGETKSDVPADLWIPEGAPKEGAAESKPVPAAESALAPAQSGFGQPQGDPKKADGLNPQPTDPPLKPPAEEITGPVPSPGAEASLPPSALEPKPVPIPAKTAAGVKREIDASAAAPKALDQAVREAKPAGLTQEPAASSRDSGTGALAPAAAAAAVGGEPGRGSSGENKLESPVTGGTNISPGKPGAASSEARDAAGSPKDAGEPGWVSIPNSGKVPLDSSDEPARGSSEAVLATGSVPAAAAGDLRAHATRDVAFELEPSQSPNRQPAPSDSTGGQRRSGAGSASEPQPRAASHSERVEATDHLVERGENYWTISRQYYNSGRYHRALWKANESKYPDINVLHVGDLIVVPAVEDLDPDYILPARTRAPSSSRVASGDASGRGLVSRRDDETDSAAAGTSSRSPESPPSRRVSLAAGSGAAASRRADDADSDLDLPASGGSSRPDRLAPYKGRSPAASSVFGGTGDEPEARTSARPRSPGTTPGRPVYRVRAYDTLRSIARDTLGDPRRADEILELNRGLIDDPAQLVSGQVLELPEDARTAIRRPASRR